MGGILLRAVSSITVLRAMETFTMSLVLVLVLVVEDGEGGVVSWGSSEKILRRWDSALSQASPVRVSVKSRIEKERVSN